MKIEDYGPYNFNDMLAKMEDEMEIHVSAVSAARKGISHLFDEMEKLSMQIYYLESILDEHGISYHRYDQEEI